MGKQNSEALFKQITSPGSVSPETTKPGDLLFKDLVNKPIGDAASSPTFNDTRYDSQIDVDKYKDYMPYGVYTLEAIDRVRAEEQGIGGELGGFLTQAVMGELIGGTINSIGSLWEATGGKIADYLSGSETEFDNLIMRLGDDIQKYSTEIAPIYQKDPNGSFNFGDTAWWMQGAVSVVSGVSMLAGAKGVGKGLGFLADLTRAAKIVDKVGDTAKYWTNIAATSAFMRNAEAMRDSAGVVSKVEQEVFNKVSSLSDEDFQSLLATQDKLPQDASRSEYARRMGLESGYTTYKLNSMNYVFDVIQTASIFKALKGRTRTGAAGSAKVAESQSQLIGGISNTAVKPSIIDRFLKPLAAGFSEAPEEMINHAASQAGERVGTNLGRKDNNTMEKFISDAFSDKGLEAGFFGYFGGKVFEAVGGRLNRDSNEHAINTKISEIAGRVETAKSSVKNIQDLVQQHQDGAINHYDFESGVVSEARKVGFDLGANASKAGNVDLLLETLNSKDFRNIVSGGTDAEGLSIDKLVFDGLNSGALEAENAYKNLYQKMFYSTRDEREKQAITDMVMTVSKDVTGLKQLINTANTEFGIALGAIPTTSEIYYPRLKALEEESSKRAMKVLEANKDTYQFLPNFSGMLKTLETLKHIHFDDTVPNSYNLKEANNPTDEKAVKALTELKIASVLSSNLNELADNMLTDDYSKKINKAFKEQEKAVFDSKVKKAKDRVSTLIGEGLPNYKIMDIVRAEFPDRGVRSKAKEALLEVARSEELTQSKIKAEVNKAKKVIGSKAEKLYQDIQKTQEDIETKGKAFALAANLALSNPKTNSKVIEPVEQASTFREYYNEALSAAVDPEESSAVEEIVEPLAQAAEPEQIVPKEVVTPEESKEEAPVKKAKKPRVKKESTVKKKEQAPEKVTDVKEEVNKPKRASRKKKVEAQLELELQTAEEIQQEELQEDQLKLEAEAQTDIELANEVEMPELVITENPTTEDLDNTSTELELDDLLQESPNIVSVTPEVLESLDISVPNPDNSIEQQKADIERRRQDSLETTKQIGEDKLKEGRETTKNIVESLKQRYPATSAKGIIIRILEKLIDFSKYSTIVDSEYINGRNASGQATWFGMMISQETLDGILSGKEHEVHTFIHEFIHGFTTSKISDYNISKQGLIPGFKSQLTQKEINAIEQLQRIFDKVKKDNPNSKDYGFTNLDEFIAEAFSNESFQYTLKNTKAEGKKSNLFTDFINAIGDILFEQLERWAKRHNKEIPNRETITGILEDVLAWTEELIDQNNKLAYIGTNEEINAKYDAELAALDSNVSNQSSQVQPSSEVKDSDTDRDKETSYANIYIPAIVSPTIVSSTPTTLVYSDKDLKVLETLNDLRERTQKGESVSLDIRVADVEERFKSDDPMESPLEIVHNGTAIGFLNRISSIQKEIDRLNYEGSFESAKVRALNLLETIKIRQAFNKNPDTKASISYVSVGGRTPSNQVLTPITKVTESMTTKFYFIDNETSGSDFSSTLSPLDGEGDLYDSKFIRPTYNFDNLYSSGNVFILVPPTPTSTIDFNDYASVAKAIPLYIDPMTLQEDDVKVVVLEVNKILQKLKEGKSPFKNEDIKNALDRISALTMVRRDITDSKDKIYSPTFVVHGKSPKSKGRIEFLSGDHSTLYSIYVAPNDEIRLTKREWKGKQGRYDSLKDYKDQIGAYIPINGKNIFVLNDENRTTFSDEIKQALATKRYNIDFNLSKEDLLKSLNTPGRFGLNLKTIEDGKGNIVSLFSGKISTKYGEDNVTTKIRLKDDVKEGFVQRPESSLSTGSIQDVEAPPTDLTNSDQEVVLTNDQLIVRFGRDVLDNTPINEMAELSELAYNFKGDEAEAAKDEEYINEDGSEYSPAFDDEADYNEYLEGFEERKLEYQAYLSGDKISVLPQKSLIKPEPTNEVIDLPDDDITDILTDGLFFKASTDKTSSKVIETGQAQIDNFRKVIGQQIPLEVLPYQLMDNGDVVYGVFKDAAVKLSKYSVEGTEYHEAFHTIFNLYFDSTNQLDILEEANKKYVLVENLDTEESRLKVEEFLAEKFRSFMLSKDARVQPKTLPEKIQAFFDKLYRMLQSYFGNLNRIDRIFEGASRGDFKNSSRMIYTGVERFSKEQVIDPFTTMLRSEEQKKYIQHGALIVMRVLRKRDNITLEDITEGRVPKLKDDYRRVLEHHLSSKSKGTPAYETTQFLIDSLSQEGNSFWPKVVEYVNDVLKISISGDDVVDPNSIQDALMSKNWDDSKHNSVSQKVSLGFELKRFLMTTEEVNSYKYTIVDGKPQFSYTPNVNNLAELPQVANFNILYTLLTTQLVDAPSVQEMMARILNLAEANPSFALIYQRLLVDESYQDKLYTAFNKAKVDSVVVRYAEGTATKMSIPSISYKLTNTLADGVKTVIESYNNPNSRSLITTAKINKFKERSIRIRGLNVTRTNVTKAHREDLLGMMSTLGLVFTDRQLQLALNSVGNRQTFSENKVTEITEAQVFEKLRVAVNKLGEELLNQALVSDKIKFDEQGRVNEVAAFFQDVILDTTEPSFYNAEKSLEYSIQKPLFINNFFSALGQVYDRRTVLKDQAYEKFTNKIQKLAAFSPIRHSNWLNSIVNLTNWKLKDDTAKNFKFKWINGLENKNSFTGVSYSSMTDYDWYAVKLLMFMKNKDFAEYALPVLSDSKRIGIVQAPIYKGFTDGKLDKTSNLYKALKNMIYYDLNAADKARQLLFNSGTLSEDVKDNLTSPYHYKETDSNNDPILIKDNKPTGLVFQTLSMTYKDGGKVRKISDIIGLDADEDLVYVGEEKKLLTPMAIFYNGIYDRATFSPDKVILVEKFISKFVKHEITQSFDKYMNILDDLKPDFERSSYEVDADLVADFIMNTFIANNEISILFNGTNAEYKNTVAHNKRSKQLISPTQYYDTKFRGERSKYIIIPDIYITVDTLRDNSKALAESLIKTNPKFKGLSYSHDIAFDEGIEPVEKERSRNTLEQKVYDLMSPYLSVNSTDGQGFITLDYLENLLNDRGILDRKTKELINDLRNGAFDILKEKKLSQVLQVLKPYYVIREINPVTGVLEEIQIKTSVQVLIPALIRGTVIEKIANTVGSDVSHIYTRSAVKVGEKRTSVITIDSMLDKSSNHLKQARLDAKGYVKERKSDLQTKEDYIADYLSGKKGINPASFERYLDKNLKKERLNFIRKDGDNIDDLSQTLTNYLDQDVSVEDITSFLSDYKSVTDYWRSVEDLKYEEFVDLYNYQNSDTTKLKLNVQTLDNSQWGLQLDIPEHLKDTTNKLSIQAKKSLLVNVSPNESFSLLGVKLSGKEIHEKIQEVFSTYSDRGTSDVLEELRDPTAIAETLTKYIDKNNLPQHYKELLEVDERGNFKTPLGIPAFSKKFQSLLIKPFVKKGLEVKVLGGHVTLLSDTLINSFVDLSSVKLGRFSKEVKARIESEGAVNLKQSIVSWKGKPYVETECLMPTWTKKFFDAYGRLDISQIPEESLKFLGHRTPLEGKYSFLSLKCVGFLPEAVGSTMVLPGALVAQTGHDFDADSEYLIFPYLGEDLEIIKPDLTKPISKWSDKELNNFIYFAYKSIIEHPSQVQEHIVPSSFTEIKDAIRRQKVLLNKADESKNHNSIETQDDLRSVNMMGVHLKGVAVNYLGMIPISQKLRLTTAEGVKVFYSKDNYTLETLKNKYPNVEEVKDGFVVSHDMLGWTQEGFTHLKEYLISMGIAKTVANILDIVKEGALLNLNLHTAGKYMTARTLGIPLEVTSLLLIQPVIMRDYTNSQKSTIVKSKPKEAVLHYLDLLHRVEKALKMSPTKFKDIEKQPLSESGLEWNLTYVRDNLLKKLEGADKEKLLEFRRYVINQLSVYKTWKLIDYTDTAYNVIMKGTGIDKGKYTSLTDLYAGVKAYEDMTGTFITSNGKTVLDALNKTKVYTSIPNYVKNVRKVLNTGSRYFLELNPTVIEATQLLSRRYNPKIHAKVTDVATFGLLNTTIDSYETERILRAVPLTDSDITFEEFKLLSTANKLWYVKYKYRNSIDPTSILYHLHPKINESDFKLKSFYEIKFNKPTLSDGLDEYLAESFVELTKSEDPYLQDIGRDLINYNYVTQGFSFGSNSFANYIPISVLNELGWFNNLKTAIDRRLDLTGAGFDAATLADLTARNSWKDNAISKIVFINKDNLQEGDALYNVTDLGTFSLPKKVVDTLPYSEDYYTFIIKSGKTEKIVQALKTEMDNIVYFSVLNRLSNGYIKLEASDTSIIESNNTWGAKMNAVDLESSGDEDMDRIDNVDDDSVIC